MAKTITYEAWQEKNCSLETPKFWQERGVILNEAPAEYYNQFQFYKLMINRDNRKRTSKLRKKIAEPLRQVRKKNNRFSYFLKPVYLKRSREKVCFLWEIEQKRLSQGKDKLYYEVSKDEWENSFRARTHRMEQMIRSSTKGTLSYVNDTRLKINNANKSGVLNPYKKIFEFGGQFFFTLRSYLPKQYRSFYDSLAKFIGGVMMRSLTEKKYNTMKETIEKYMEDPKIEEVMIQAKEKRDSWLREETESKRRDRKLII